MTLQTSASEVLIFCEYRSPVGVDPISTLVTKLEASPVWSNGRFQPLKLPATATADELVPLLFENVSFDQGRVRTFRIVETRVVHICDIQSKYIAVLIETEFGPKIALFIYHEALTGWWNRVFDSSPSA
jgi:hypothetical protein